MLQPTLTDRLAVRASSGAEPQSCKEVKQQKQNKTKKSYFLFPLLSKVSIQDLKTT